VLTGPDHLSALATLSATVPDFCTSFFLGVRWGVGHSTGLLLVGVILIIRDYSKPKKDDEDVVEVPDALGHFFETLVGFFMLFLGVYGFRRALRKRRAFQSISSEDPGDDNEKIETHGNGLLQHTGCGIYHDHQIESLADMFSDDSPSQPALELESGDSKLVGRSERGCGSLFQFSQSFSAKTIAVLAGIIHGLAGPGGVLGVIPAVQLHDWKLATIYLGCFCVSSTITMGCFASFYGLCSSSVGRRTNLEFQIHCFSAGLCILVGITWLVLLSMGKLEDVFP
jgi:hypothetical protein